MFPRKLTDKTPLVVAALLPLLFLLSRAYAHDPRSRHENSALTDAKNRSGSVCCSGHDYMIANGWERLPSGLYRVLISDQWLDVPEEAYVVNVRNPYTEAIVWLYSYHESGYGPRLVVRCFKEGIAS
jgi:hypothetical protein